MKIIYLGIIGWVSSFVILLCTFFIFEMAEGTLGSKEEIIMGIEAAALIATCLTIVVSVIAVAAPLINIELKL